MVYVFFAVVPLSSVICRIQPACEHFMCAVNPRFMVEVQHFTVGIYNSPDLTLQTGLCVVLILSAVEATSLFQYTFVIILPDDPVIRC